jgi:hypothetical protein
MTKEEALSFVETCAEQSKTVKESFKGEPEKLQDAIRLLSDD